MPTGDVSAVRNDLLDPDADAAPEFVGGAQHAVDVSRRVPLPRRLLGLAPGTVVSAAVHVVIVALGLMFWRAMLHDLTAPEPISVEIVHSIPGEAAPAGSTAEQPKQPEPAPPAEPKPPQPEAKEPEVRKPEPEAKPPKPTRSVLDDALPPPDTGAPSLPPIPKPQQASGQPVPAPAATPSPMPREPSAVEPPPEPKAAATQTDKQAANTSATETPAPRPPPPAKALPVPSVLSASGGDTAVPAPPPEPDPTSTAKQAAPDTQALPDPTAQLAAALPQNPFSMPSTFRAMLSGQGQSEAGQYKGAVFGMLGRGRAHQVAEDAKRRGLKGQVVVRFTVGDSGALDDLSILQSSGKPAVDAAAEAMVRGAAPFPPPPPGGQRVFTPALAFGG